MCVLGQQLGRAAHRSSRAHHGHGPSRAVYVGLIDPVRETHYLLTTLNVPAEALWHSRDLHHSPLLLAWPKAWLMEPRASAFVWIAMDMISGLALLAIAHAVAKRAERHVRIVPAHVAACFLLNPYAVAACVAKSMSQLRTCLTLLALLGAVHGASFVVACVQALNSVLFVIPLYVAPALVLLGADAHAQYGRWRAGFGHRQSDAWWQWLRRTIVRFVGWLVAWLVLAALCSRDPTLAFIRSVYGSRLLVDDLSPNAGLVWYFFVEMFPHFRAFFIMVVNLHMLSYTVPALLHWRRDPLFATTVLVGIHALFQTYPSVGDTALYLALWSLHYSRLCDYLRYPMVTTLFFLYSTLLGPAFLYLWLYTGSANANFFYAINLVHALGLGSLLLDSIWASGRERWEIERAKEPRQEGMRYVVQE